jgi:hypothetical protein
LSDLEPDNTSEGEREMDMTSIQDIIFDFVKNYLEFLMVPSKSYADLLNPTLIMDLPIVLSTI